MRRMAVVFLGLVVLLFAAIAAWFVLQMDAGGDTTGPRSPDATETAGGDEAQDDVEGPKRDRVRTGESDDGALASDRWVLRGTVVDDAGPVPGAEVVAYAVPSGDDVRDNVRVLREVLGDRFADEDLDFMARQARSGGMFGRPGSADEDEPEELEPEDVVEQDGGGSTSITVTVGSGGTRVESSGPDRDEIMETASRGQNIAKRMFSEDGLLDRMIALSQLAAARFESDGEFAVASRTTTAADGTFELAGLVASRIEVRVRAPGHVRLKRRVGKRSKAVTLHIRRGTVLEGLVVAAGEPVAGASVRTKTMTLTTDGGGRFRLDGAVTPRESVLVTADGYIAAARVVPLTVEGPNEPITIELEAAGEIHGVVVDADGAPVAGASVMPVSKTINPMSFMSFANNDSFDAPPPTARTGADGLFVLGALPPGMVTLLAERDGFLAGRIEDIEVRAREITTDARIVLTREAVLAGVVTGPDGTPLSGATVEVQAPAPTGMAAMIAQAMGGAWTSAVADESGRFRVTRLHAGERRVRVKADGHLKAEDEVQLLEGKTAERDYRLEAGYEIAGTVYDPSGSPQMGATVFVTWSEDTGGGMMQMMGMQGGEQRTAVTDADGRYVADGLGEGPYKVEARAPGFLKASVEGILPGAVGVDVTLGAAATLSGIVIDGDGAPVSGAMVRLQGGAGRGGGAPWMQMMGSTTTAVTDQSGRFELGGLEPGKYRLSARADGFADSETLNVTCEAGVAQDGFELVLLPGAQLSGVVVEKGTGIAVAGAIVYVSRAEGMMAQINPADMAGGEPAAPPDSINTTTAPDGSFTLDGLNPGKVTVQIRSRDHAPHAQPGVTAPGSGVTIEISPGGDVEGVVQDAAGNPLVGQQIMLTGGAMGFGSNRSATTDTDGFYRFERLRPGTYNLMRLDGSSGSFGMSGMTPVTVRDGETTRHDFKPRADTSTITGTVVLGAAPLADAAVILSGGPGGMQMGSTDDAGQFEFENVAPGDYTITVQRGMMGGGTTQAKVSVPPNGGVIPPVRLAISELSVRGRVLDAGTDEPIGFAQVVLLAPGASRLTSLDDLMNAQRGQAFSGDDGRFAIEGVEAGSFSLRVSAANYVEQTIEGVTAGGADLTVRLSAGSELRVTVSGSDGKPVAGATVLVLDDSGRESLPFRMSMQGTTGEDGVATLRLGPGRHRLVAESATHPSVEFDVDGRAGSAAVTLPSGGSLDVVVTRDGEPVEGIAVAVLDAKGQPIEKRITMSNFSGSGRTTDAAGRLHRDGLPAGQVVVVASNAEGVTTREIVTISAGGTAEVNVELR